MNSVTLNVKNLGLTNEQFYQLSRINNSWRLELTTRGELLIMSPIGGKSGQREATLIGKLWLWNEETKLGVVFSSSTIFCLPNGGKRSPDVAWVSLEKWNHLSEEDKEKFPPLCPDFVIELRSRTDQLKDLQDKMLEYLDAGLKLGWLINPQQQKVEIYRTNKEKEIISLPSTLSGEDVLPNFILEIATF